MTQQEKFSLHFAYGVKCSVTGELLVFEIVGLNLNLIEYYEEGRTVSEECHYEDVKPYLRSFDQLTKPITQKDYNDGKPFVPSKIIWKANPRHKELAEYFVNTNQIEKMTFDVIRLLLKWHFQVGFEQGEYIEVTEENNPY